jgi:radical SAM superfamily enzyme YgiQ (UPF0313 family)
MGKVDLLLINPGSWSAVYGQVGKLSGIAPPLGIGLIAAYIRENGFSVDIIDAEADNISPEGVAEIVRQREPLLAGVSACTPKMTASIEIISHIKKTAPGVKTIIGGHHPAALPELTLQESEVDFVCNAEGFFPTLDLLKILKADPKARSFPVKGIWYRENGRIVKNAPPELIKNLDELPYVAWDLLPMGKYRSHNWQAFGYEDRSPYAVVFTSLGCPFRCTYCSVNAVYGKGSYRTRSPEHFVGEIDMLVEKFNVKHMEIVDDTFTVNKKRVHEICDLLIERGHTVNFWAYARTDTVDMELLKKMKKAGINWVCYGFESGSEIVRKGVRKGQKKIEEAVKLTYEAGLNIISNFMFGLPDDDNDTMRLTLDLAKEINGEYANFYSVMAYPGSDLYNEAVEKGYPLPKQWHDYSQYAYETLPLPTKHLTGPEVLKFRDLAFNEYFSNPKYQEKVRERFGPEVEDSIKAMLKKKLKRKYVPEDE